jgi:Stigma-specific protein, Stig1
MDSKQFDALSRTLANGVSRRRAMARVGTAGLAASLAALTGRRVVDALPAMQAETCRLTIVATVRVGPSASTLFQGNVPGELRGDLSFSIGQGGAIDTGRLRLDGGTDLPAVGQATGRALNLRVQAGIGQTLVFDGTGEQSLDRCTGAVDGLFTGPQAGDLGDWHATATALGGTTGGGGAAPTATTSPTPSATATTAPAATATSAAPTATGTSVPAATATATVPAETATPPATATATTAPTETPTSVPTETPTTVPTETPTPEPPTPTPVSCPAGTTDCNGVCLDLQNDVNNCGTCGHVCPAGQPGFVPGCAGGNCLFMREQACGSGLAFCNDVCVDTQTDPANCGFCGNVCGAGEVCFAGVCAREHRCAPLVNCNDVCVDLATDAANCGACGNVCAADEICFGGLCAREHRT